MVSGDGDFRDAGGTTAGDLSDRDALAESPVGGNATEADFGFLHRGFFEPDDDIRGDGGSAEGVAVIDSQGRAEGGASVGGLEELDAGGVVGAGEPGERDALADGGHGRAIGGAAIDLPAIGVSGAGRGPGSGGPADQGDVADFAGLMIAIGGEEAAGRFDDGGLAAGADVDIEFAVVDGMALAVEGNVAERFAVFDRGGSEVDGAGAIGDEAEEAGVVLFFV